MKKVFFALQPGLSLLPPELAHRLALKALTFAPVFNGGGDDPRLCSAYCGLSFPNPLGMAAGFDKNAEVYDKLLSLGFGFAEVGAVTPHPQKGNPQPRLFRLPEDRALINRMGFNNEGLDIVAARLRRLQSRPGIVGVNLGANKDSADKTGDYVTLLRAFDGLADFVTLNISSPNTPGLRQLQDKQALDAFLSRVLEERSRIRGRKQRAMPVLLKISPDILLPELDDIAALALTHKIDGLVISNTTLERENLYSGLRKEAGGLSGAPLFALSTRRLAQMRQRVGPDMLLIGVGGIDSAATALDKLCAGANLLQLYTGLVYRGLGLLDEIKHGLLQRLGAEGTLQNLISSRVAEFARE